jgi:hypothetical protein
MRIVDYDSNDSSMLTRLASKLPAHHGLRCQSFVDYYYTTFDACRLHLMLDDDDEILGVVGLEKMNFSTPDGDVTLGFGSNFHAFESGAGGLLFLHWLKQCKFGIVFGGNDNTQRIIEHQKWSRFSGVSVYQINHAYAEVPGEALWRKTVKEMLRRAPFKTDVGKRCSVDAVTSDPIEAIPETVFDSEMLPVATSFSVRFAPTVEHLNWRYAGDLDFVKYRSFRLVQAGQSIGYVVLNEQRNRTLVAQCDAPNSDLLTQGIFAALRQACSGSRRHCGVVLSTSSPVVKSAFETLGFKQHPAGRSLAIGGIGRTPKWGDDTSDWLINYDWGDNGLRAPFLGASFISEPSLHAA